MHCSLEEFHALKKKAFRNIPRSLLIKVLEELPDYASIVYLRLYDLAESNTKYAGTVIISYSALGQKLKKSESSIKRAVKELKEKGYIEVIQQGAKEKKYLPNIIRVLCPKNVVQEIMKEEDRKFSVLKFPLTTPETKMRSNSSKQSNSVLENAPKKISEELVNEATSNEPYVILKYQQVRDTLQTKGITGFKLAQEARKALTAQELIEYDKYIYSESKKPSSHFSYTEKPKMDGVEAKNDLHKINNSDHRSLRLTIDDVVDKNQLNDYMANLWTNTIVNFEKENPIVNSAISELENRMIESKLRAMSKCKEIHTSLETFGLRRLIAEVKFHVIYRDLNKTPTVKHALNAAAVMLRDGAWSTPKRLASLCTQRVEKAIKYIKEKETFGIKNYPATKINRLVNLGDVLKEKMME